MADEHNARTKDHEFEKIISLNLRIATKSSPEWWRARARCPQFPSGLVLVLPFLPLLDRSSLVILRASPRGNEWEFVQEAFNEKPLEAVVQTARPKVVAALI